MSTLCLLYPKKPQELADDLESFIYILVRMALRFHKHEKSLDYDSENRSPDDIRKANATNEELATWVSSFFDAQTECEDGYWSGGSSKKDWLESTMLPVKLVAGSDGKETLLAGLLRSLYGLLRQHYGAINYADIERFKVKKKRNGSTVAAVPDTERMTEGSGDPSPSANPEPAPPPVTADPLSRIKSRMTRARNENPPSGSGEEGPPPAPTPAPVAPKCISAVTIPNPRRVLDTHVEIFKAFDDAFFYDQGRTKRRILTLYVHDKWYDQFDGLKAALNMEETNPSGQSKRKVETGEEQLYEEVWGEGRKKRVRGLTYRVHIPRTVVEQPEPQPQPDSGVDDASE